MPGNETENNYVAWNSRNWNIKLLCHLEYSKLKHLLPEHFNISGYF